MIIVMRRDVLPSWARVCLESLASGWDFGVRKEAEKIHQKEHEAYWPVCRQAGEPIAACRASYLPAWSAGKLDGVLKTSHETEVFRLRLRGHKALRRKRC